MEPAIFTIELTPADVRRFFKFAHRSPARWRRTIILYTLAAALFTAAYFLKNPDPAHSDSGTVKIGMFHNIWPILVSVVFFIGLVIFFYRRALRPENIKKSSPAVFLPKTFTVLDDGLLCRNEGGESM